MHSHTSLLPDYFVGSYHLPINPETLLVPTGYDKEAFSRLKPDLDWVETDVMLERTQDADGVKLLIDLAFKDTLIKGFYYYDKQYALTAQASGLHIVCRSVVEILSVYPLDDNENNHSLNPLVDMEFLFIDDVGRQKGVVSWLELIAEGSQILANKAFIASQLPLSHSPIPTQL